MYKKIETKKKSTKKTWLWTIEAFIHPFLVKWILALVIPVPDATFPANSKNNISSLGKFWPVCHKPNQSQVIHLITLQISRHNSISDLKTANILDPTSQKISAVYWHTHTGSSFIENYPENARWIKLNQNKTPIDPDILTGSTMVNQMHMQNPLATHIVLKYIIMVLFSLVIY